MHGSNTSSIAATLAGFVTGFDLDTVPAATVARAKHLLLDSFGVALASSSFEFGRIAARGLAALETGSMPVIGLRQRLTMRDAVLVNGILVHGIDYDDTSIHGRVHPSSFCATTALGVAAHRRLSGRDLLAAYIAGLECSIRIGAVALGGFQRRGFHPGGVVASFGSALIASRLLGLDAGQCGMAQGIAYATAAGNQEFAATMAWTKRFHPGWGSNGGITAAALASEGFTGPPLPYEGRFGLYRLYIGGDEWDFSPATDALGEHWLLDEISVKPLPACYFNVSLIDAAVRIFAEHRPDPAGIEAIEVLVPEAATHTVCEPQSEKRRPTDSYAAQFSAYYATAAALRNGRFALEDLTSEALADPGILAMVDKVSYRVDPQSTFPKHYSGAVVVRMKNGAVFEAREDVDRGSPERPLSNGDVVEKFRRNAALSAVASRSEAIAETILHLESMADAHDLAEDLAGADRENQPR